MKLGIKKSEDFTIFAEIKSQSDPHVLVDDSQNPSPSFRILNTNLSCHPAENCNDQKI